MQYNAIFSFDLPCANTQNTKTARRLTLASSAAFTLSHFVIGLSQHSQILPPTPEKMILADAVQIVHRHFPLLLQSPRHYQTCNFTLK